MPCAIHHHDHQQFDEIFFRKRAKEAIHREGPEGPKERRGNSSSVRATRHSRAAPSAATADCELVRHDPRKMLPCSKPFSKKPVQMDHRGVPQAFQATHAKPNTTTKRLETNERPRNLTSRQRTGPRHSLNSVRSQHTTLPHARQDRRQCPPGQPTNAQLTASKQSCSKSDVQRRVRRYRCYCRPSFPMTTQPFSQPCRRALSMLACWSCRGVGRSDA